MTASACPTSGCGSTDAYLDTSTERTAAWVQVRSEARPAHAAGWRWYCRPQCASAALGGETEQIVRTRLAGEITAALDLLAEAGLDPYEVLGRQHGLETARRIVAPDRLEESAARCYLCGCTENNACAGGCYWASDVLMRDVCSACAPAGPCRTAGCGTTADHLDDSDPELWGWIRLQVAGSECEPVWVCSPLCAAEVMGRAADELAAAAGEVDVTADLIGGAR